MVVLDEMDTKAGLDYCIQSGIYIGSVTLPKHEVIGTKTLLIMLDGINTRWKQLTV